MDEIKGDLGKFLEWMKRQPKRVQAAIVRRQERGMAKQARRDAAPAVRAVGYQCPRCWEFFPTPEARLEHRASHWKPEASNG